MDSEWYASFWQIASLCLGNPGAFGNDSALLYSSID
jgi:hypothetical protein